MTGLILGPAPTGRWDDERRSCPIVLRDATGYRMWYYGRESGFPGLEPNVMGVLPMGRSGLATSDDGVHWTRVIGRGEKGSVFDPNPDPAAFDSFMIGATDVVPVEGRLRMYYMGTPVGPIDPLTGNVGQPVRIGIAESNDGLGFNRFLDGPILSAGNPGSWDSRVAGFARVMPLPGGGWRMSYTGGDETEGAIGLAESPDGLRWEKRGILFRKSDRAGAFDDRRVSTRHIIPWQGGYVMAYEALGTSSGPVNYRIGIATSADGLHWERQIGPGYGGCALDLGTAGSWDALAIGTPYLVAEPNGSLKLYYVGFSEAIVTNIGLATCDGHDLTLWERVTI